MLKSHQVQNPSGTIDTVSSVQEGLEWLARSTKHLPVSFKVQGGRIRHVQHGRMTLSDRAVVMAICDSVSRRVCIAGTYKELTNAK